jgi:chlorite dismutase
MSTHDPSPAAPPKQPGLPEIDVREHGGKGQTLDRRMFFQLVVVDATRGTGDAIGAALADRLASARVPHVVYADLLQPAGTAVLTWSEDPAHFVGPVRAAFGSLDAGAFTYRPSFSMIGRTYASGHEPDLEHWLLRRPVENVLNGDFAWHVWYPLRRVGPFNRLDGHEQAQILREHAQIGFAYGTTGLASDVRLACHGLDADDNDFLIGLVGRELHPLSHLVQTMRKTVQTSQWIAKMGPFFVGKVAHRSA